MRTVEMIEDEDHIYLKIEKECVEVEEGIVDSKIGSIVSKMIVAVILLLTVCCVIGFMDESKEAKEKIKIEQMESNERIEKLAKEIKIK